MVLREIAPDVTLEQLREITPAEFVVEGALKPML